jgi:hypothetical protein
MTVTILQPGYLPWLGFFDQMLRSDVFVIYDDVQYDKHGWRNRNRIKTPSGPLWLTVPVLVSHQNKPRTLEVKVDHHIPWVRKHIGSIKQFYSKAPYFSEYVPPLEEVLGRPWELLVDLDLAVLNLFCGWLNISTKIVRSSELAISGDQSERLLKICKHFQATHYLSGDSAQSYLDINLFKQNQIEVIWQNYKHPTYSQLHGDFVPFLSILDLILNCGSESISILQPKTHS